MLLCVFSGLFQLQALQPEDEQLHDISVVMRTLHMAGLGECDIGSLYPENDEVRLRYAVFR